MQQGHLPHWISCQTCLKTATETLKETYSRIPWESSTGMNTH